MSHSRYNKGGTQKPHRIYIIDPFQVRRINWEKSKQLMRPRQCRAMNPMEVREPAVLLRRRLLIADLGDCTSLMRKIEKLDATGCHRGVEEGSWTHLPESLAGTS